MVLVLGHRDVADLLDLPTAVAVTEALFREQAAGDVAPDPPHLLRLRPGVMRLVAGALLGSRRGGVRVSAGSASGDPTALLYDLDDGGLLCIQAYPFSSLRIAATVGLVTKLLAPGRVLTVGLIGTGRNAQSVLEGVCWARPEVERIRLYSRREEHRRQFADAMRAALGRDVTAVDAGRAVVEGAEVVLTATDPQAPVLHGDWLRPGQLVIPIGRPNELDAVAYQRADLVVVTQRHHEENYYDRDLEKPLLDLLARGELTCADFHDVVAGRVTPPPPDTSLVVVRESQGGVGDMALANYAYTQAVALGRGQHISLA
jgi:ornithine cyclodeaminase/alanine dehydrogenase-like protein (mu-crystallin family)